MIIKSILWISKNVQHVKELHNEYAHAKFWNDIIFGTFIAAGSEKVWRQFLALQSLWVLHIVEKTNGIFGNLRNSESEACTYFLMQKYSFENWSNAYHYQYLRVKMTQKTCGSRHVGDFYFLATFCDLTLTLTYSGMTFVLTQYPSQTFTSFLCGFQPFAAHLTAPYPKCEKVFFNIELTLTLFVTFTLKC